MRKLAVCALVLAVVPLLGAGSGGDRVVLSGNVRVPNGETAEEVVVFSGDVAVGGLVRGDVVAFSGRVVVTGQVSGDVVSFDGPVLLGPNAQVGGSVIARDAVTRRPGAQVGGSVGAGFPVTFRAPALLSGRLGFWLSTTFSVLVLGLLLMWIAPRASDVVHETLVGSKLRSVLAGLAWFVGLPVLACAMAVTLMGLPFGLGLLMALAFLYSLAYTWGIWVVGRLILPAPRNRFLSFTLGWVIVRGLSAVPYLDAALWIVLVIPALGAMWLATWRARRPAPPGRHRASAERASQPIVPGWDERSLAP
jgi:cytoskeletal protein CcmA (bactofilin family)